MNPITTIIRGLIAKKAVDTASDALNSDTAKSIARDAEAGLNMVAQGASDAANGAINWAGNAAKDVKNTASRVLSDAAEKGKSAFNKALDSYFKIFGLGYKDGQVYSPSVEKAISKAMGKDENSLTSLQEVLEALEKSNRANASEEDTVVAETTPEGTTETVELAKSEPENDADTVTYTYKPGDTFGQVLLNLGLSDGSRLWGRGGDVEFYTQQLIAQDMLDRNGNVKLGIPFKLRRRK